MLKKIIIITSVLFIVPLRAMEKCAESGSDFIKRARKEHSLLKKFLPQENNCYSIYSPSQKVLISIKSSPTFLLPYKLLDIQVAGCSILQEPKKLPAHLKNISVVFNKQERYVVVQGSLSKQNSSRYLSIPYAATFRLPEVSNDNDYND